MGKVITEGKNSKFVRISKDIAALLTLTALPVCAEPSISGSIDNTKLPNFQHTSQKLKANI